MLRLFTYNWQVRDDWFELLDKVSIEELQRERMVGSILKTLFHIVDSEYSWIAALRGETDLSPDYQNYETLEAVKNLSEEYKIKVNDFLNLWNGELEHKIISVAWSDQAYTYGEILRHVIAHEIHHIGQLSVWSKELGVQVVSANFIGRGIV